MPKKNPSRHTSSNEFDLSLSYADIDESDRSKESLDDKFRDASGSMINWTEAGFVFLPNRIKYLAIVPSIEIAKKEFEPNEIVTFNIVFRNRLPFPIKIRTESKLPWSWSINNVEKASHYVDFDPSGEQGTFILERSERRSYTRKWSQKFRVSKSKWEDAMNGEYELSAWINVPDPQSKGLQANTSFVIG